MLTPYFELSQTENAIHLMIKAPLANIANTELTVDNDNTVLFYSSPYYLRINLPGNVREIESSSGQYDCERGEFRFLLEKCTSGENFEDLDMIGKLLLPRNKIEATPSIQVLGEDINVTASSDNESEEDEDWFIHSAEVPMEENISELGGGKYGFANKLSGLEWVTHTREEFHDALDIQDIDYSSSKERAKARKAEENNDFSDDHYMADFMEPDDILPRMLLYVPPWQMQERADVELTVEEKDELRKLGNKEYLLDKNELRTALLSLVDIIFAYAYNHRFTMGENTVVSAWTINKISATLSWFQSYTDMKDVKVTSARRSLIYPLCRNWDLTTTVFNDTKNILSLGRRQILKCLLEIHSLFNASEPRYLLNRLYITDYCIWLQKCSERLIKKLADSFSKVTVKKGDVKLDIEELEAAAISVYEEEDTCLLLNKIIHKKMEGLSIQNPSKSLEESNGTYKSFKVISEPNSSSSDSSSSSSSSSSSAIDSDEESETCSSDNDECTVTEEDSDSS